MCRALTIAVWVLKIKNNFKRKRLFFLAIYLDQRVKAPLSKHVLEEGVVLWAADMGLQLGGQSRQQLVQTCRRGEEETQGLVLGSGRYDINKTHTWTQICTHLCFNNDNT